MSLENHEVYINDLLPEWAVSRADPSKWQLGAQLPTKDGRRVGNAHIVGIIIEMFSGENYQIITDAGTPMICTPEELAELFHPPRWLTDPVVTLARFERDDHLNY